MNKVRNKLVKLYQNLSCLLFFRALIKGVAAGTEHRKLLESLDVRHVVDIGANRGQFALVARKCFPGIHIDSFEPLAEAAEKFKRVFRGDTNTHLYQYAIGIGKATMTIHVSERDDSSSLLPIGPTQSKLFPHTGEREVRKVPVLALGEAIDVDALSAPSLLKIDVQGFELEVLIGSKSILRRFSHIYVECSFIELYEGQALADDIIAFLQKYGFQLAGIYNMVYDKKGIAIQADFLFS